MIKSRIKVIIRILLIAIAIMLINILKVNAATVPNIKVNGNLLNKPWRAKNGIYCYSKDTDYFDDEDPGTYLYALDGTETRTDPASLYIFAYAETYGDTGKGDSYGRDAVQYTIWKGKATTYSGDTSGILTQASNYATFHNYVKNENWTLSVDTKNAQVTTEGDKIKYGPCFLNCPEAIKQAMSLSTTKYKVNMTYTLKVDGQKQNNSSIQGSLVDDKGFYIVFNKTEGTEVSIDFKVSVVNMLDRAQLQKYKYVGFEGGSIPEEAEGRVQELCTITVYYKQYYKEANVKFKLTKPSKYTLSFNKIDGTFGGNLAGVTFSYVDPSTGATKTVTSGSDGKFTITLDAKDTKADTITLKEVKYYYNGDTSKPYKQLGDIKITVTKTVQTINGQSYYVVDKATIILPDGKQLSGGNWRLANVNGMPVKVLDSIEIKNEPELKKTTTKVVINKVDAKDLKALQGAKFKISINDETGTDLTGITISPAPIDGIITIGSDGQITVDKIPVEALGTLTITLEEVAAPEYYYTPKGKMVIKVTKKADKDAWAYIVENVEVTDFDTSEIKAKVQELGKTVDNLETEKEVSKDTSNNTTISLTVKNQRKYMKIEGYVWEDVPGDNKLSSVNGKHDSNERFIDGIEVVLYSDKSVYPGEPTKQSKFTENGGHYEYVTYMGAEYYVEFNYNGYNYQHTQYTTYVAPGNEQTIYSHSTETPNERKAFNSRLETISNETTIEGVKVNSKDNNLSATQLGEKKIYKISAYIGPNGNAAGMYKITGKGSNGEEIDHYKNLNLGLVKRERADIAVRKDVYSAKASIKGYTQTYNYNARELTVEEEKDANGNVVNVNKYWDISERASDIYYDKEYNRDVKAADYKYDGTNPLTLEITYVINVRNQSPTLKTKINKVAEYFDTGYALKEAYIGKRTGEKIKDINLSEGAATTIDGYKAVTLEPDETEKMLEPGADMFIFLTFDLGTINHISEIGEAAGRAYGNLTELMSYSTYYSRYSEAPNKTEYKDGDIAGRIDYDSNPGNAKNVEDFQPAGEEDSGKNREDDADRAPFIRIKIDNSARTTEGIVWEDARNKEVSLAMIGNGLYENGETLIGGVKVALFDIETNSIAKVWNGNAWVDAIAESSNEDATKGQYKIEGFVPGKYYIKFIYGNDEATTKYNGQDYKSTIYVGTLNGINTGFDYNNPDANDTYVETTERYSDARDIMGDKDTKGTREYVNNLYAGEITNAKETSLKDANGSKGQVEAKTGTMEIFIEKGGNNVSGLTGVTHIDYILSNIDFGLVERPKAQLMMTKEVESAQIILANGNTLFDVGPNGKSNAIWINKTEHMLNPYKDNLLNYNWTAKDKAEAIQITMDNESMYGASILASYRITVKNIGEIDYTGNEFYYSGVKGNGEIVTTTVGTIIDYPGAAATDDSSTSRNNLRFDSSLAENAGWEMYNKESDANLLDENVKGVLAKYTNIIKKTINKELTPDLASKEASAVSTTLKLSQILSNEADDNSYNNMAEIVSYVNKVGRKMAYSTVGNQSPEDKISEIDSDMSQTITILPPFGQKPTYFIIAGAVLVILATGIILIKKKAIK